MKVQFRFLLLFDGDREPSLQEAQSWHTSDQYIDCISLT